MIKKTLLLILVIVFLALTVLFIFREAALKSVFEYAFNATAEEPVERGSVKIDRAWIGRRFDVHLAGIRMDLTTEKGRVPIEIGRIDSDKSVAAVFTEQGLPFRVQNLKFPNSQYQGMRGWGVLRTGKNWFFKFSSNIDALGLEDIDWVDPENLNGSTGRIVGTISFGSDWTGGTNLHLETRVGQPGGRIQAKLFALLLPYLPQSPERMKLKTLSQTEELIDYQEAGLNAELVGKDRLKIVFRILIPEYNLNLNLNIEIRVDKENAFGEIAKLLGWVKVRTK